MSESNTAPPVLAALKAVAYGKLFQPAESGLNVRGCVTQLFFPCMSTRGTKEGRAWGPGLTVTPKKLVSFMALRMILPSVWSV